VVIRSQCRRRSLIVAVLIVSVVGRLLRIICRGAVGIQLPLHFIGDGLTQRR
jgi:hypothetical protein